MLRDQQKEIINDMCDSIKEYLTKKLNSVPENWDGIELREWFADTAREKYTYKKMELPRKRDYENDILVYNL